MARNWVKKYKEGYFGMFNQGDEYTNPLEELAGIKHAGETLRLMLFYMSILDYNNRIRNLPQREIAERINMTRPNVSKANKALEKAGVITRIGRDYYFNDKYMLKGIRRYKIKR